MKMVKLGDICEIRVGRTPARADASLWGSGTPWLSIADMAQGSQITHTKEQITPLASARGKLIPTGTVLLSFKLSIGKVAINQIPLFTNEAIAALSILDSKQLTSSYLLRALEAMDLSSHSNRAAMGATLNKATLYEIQIPLPPLMEQRRIAAILDRADAIRAQRCTVLAELSDLAAALFRHLFGDPSTALKTTTLGDVTSFSTGRSIVAADEADSSEYRVLKISAVTTGVFRANESKPLPPDYTPPPEHVVHRGDLLMSRANTTELVGATALVDVGDHNLALPDKIWRFDWNSTESVPEFYHQLLRDPAMRHRMSQLSSDTGGSMKNISKSKLSLMPIPLVPTDGQQGFPPQVTALNAQPTRVEAALAYDNELFESLQSRAFKGEL